MLAPLFVYHASFAQPQNQNANADSGELVKICPVCHVAGRLVRFVSALVSSLPPYCLSRNLIIPDGATIAIQYFAPCVIDTPVLSVTVFH